MSAAWVNGRPAVAWYGGRLAHEAIFLQSAYPDIAIDGRQFAVTWFDSRDGNQEVYLRCGQLGASGAPESRLKVDGEHMRRVSRTAEESIGAYLVWHRNHIELAWTEGRGSTSARRAGNLS